MAVLDKQFRSIPEPTQDTAALLKTVAALKEVVEVLTGQRNPNVKGIGDQLNDLRSMSATTNARFTDYIEVSASADEALAQRTTTLEATVNDPDTGVVANAAKITEVDTARVNGDSALAQRASTLEATVNDPTTGVARNSARITEVDQARVDGNTALANSINTVAVSAAEGTAYGQTEMRASAGIGGVSASWQILLKTTATGTGQEQATGLYFTLQDGIGRTTFVADRFTFYDYNSGVIRTILDYNGVNGWTFNANVAINGNLVVNGTIQTNGIAIGAITNTARNDSSTMMAEVFMDIRAGADVLVLATYTGAPSARHSDFYQVGTLDILADNNVARSIFIAYDYDANTTAAMPTTVQYGFTGVSAGVHSFKAQAVRAFDEGQVSITAIEFAR